MPRRGHAVLRLCCVARGRHRYPPPPHPTPTLHTWPLCQCHVAHAICRFFICRPLSNELKSGQWMVQCGWSYQQLKTYIVGHKQSPFLFFSITLTNHLIWNLITVTIWSFSACGYLNEFATELSTSTGWCSYTVLWKATYINLYIVRHKNLTVT